MSYMWYNVNLIVWLFFFLYQSRDLFLLNWFYGFVNIYTCIICTSNMAKNKWKRLRIKKKLLFFKWSWQDLQDVVIQIHVHVVQCSILSQEYIYNKWFHYYRVIRLSTLIIITNEVFFIPFSADWWCTLSTHQRESINVTKTSWWFTTELISHKPLFN